MHVVGTDAVAPLAFTHLGQPVWFEPQCPTYPAYVVVAFALNQQSVALIALWGCGSGQSESFSGQRLSTTRRKLTGGRRHTRCERCHQPTIGRTLLARSVPSPCDPSAEDHHLGISMPRYRPGSGCTAAKDAIRTARERSRMQTPAPVDYARAHSVEEALELLERYGPESRLIAGGHSLIPMMRLRIASPERVIDINDLTELDYIRLVTSNGSSYLAVGAMTRHRSILDSALIGEHYQILHDAENVIADPIVRNRGTI